MADDETGGPVAVLDLAWPKVLQEGLSQTVALMIDEGKATQEAANKQGYRYFTKVEELKQYVEHDVLALS